jgi:opacity protein-like surface antigen
MAIRPIVALAMFGGMCVAAAADVAPAPSLPLFAQTAQTEPQEPSVWSGLSIGSEFFAISGKGVRSGVGGDGFIGYNHAFANDVVVGVQTSAGYSPSLSRWSAAQGFDFASTNVKFGYDIGRFTPFVTADVVLAKPDRIGRGYTTPTDSVNNLFDSSAGVKALGTVSAGFDYAITDALTVNVAVSARSGRDPFAP